MKKILLALALVGVVLLSACASGGGGGEAEGTKRITADEAHEIITSGEPVVILDVRTAEEYAQAHIPGAILVPNEDIGTQYPEALPVLDAKILVYCRSGNRSAQAAKKLAELGYTDVSDFGGINDWTYETQSGEYVRPSTTATLTSFAAHDINGIARDDSLFKGATLTMVNIWATFCGPCIYEMPELAQLSDEYSERGVSIVGIVADVTQQESGIYSPKMIAEARDIIRRTGAHYVHLLPSIDLIVAKLQYVNYVPETIFLDENGEQVGESYIGSRSKAEWASIIEQLLLEVQA